MKGRGGTASGRGMSVDIAQVRKIASLARLALSEEEAATMTGELNAILGFVEQLGEVDVTGIEPMTAVIPNRLRLRDDAVTDGGNRAEVLANAPVSEEGFFGVPKVIE